MMVNFHFPDCDLNKNEIRKSFSLVEEEIPQLEARLFRRKVNIEALNEVSALEMKVRFELKTMTRSP